MGPGTVSVLQLYCIAHFFLSMCSGFSRQAYAIQGQIIHK